MQDTFRLTKEALTRAAYRGLLRREPDQAAASVLHLDPFKPEEEAELSQVLANFSTSDEFRALQTNLPVKPNYPPSTWARVELGDLLLWVDLGDLGVSRHCVSGDFEPMETRFICSILKPGMTFVDVGANIGWFSVNAAKLVGPAGRIFSFEPRADTFRALARTFEDNGFIGRATLVNAAVGHEPGEVSIGWSKESTNPGGTWTLAHEELERGFRARGATLQRTQVVTLDDVVADTPVDVLKIDIEGAEPLAMRGAERMLRNQRPIILCEINPSLLQNVSQTSPRAFIESMESRDYVCHALGAEGPTSRIDASAITASTGMINVVFVPRV